MNAFILPRSELQSVLCQNLLSPLEDKSLDDTLGRVRNLLKIHHFEKSPF